jgi:preprotein translocase subunit SecG
MDDDKTYGEALQELHDSIKDLESMMEKEFEAILGRFTIVMFILLTLLSIVVAVGFLWE